MPGRGDGFVDRRPLETSRCPPIGARDEEDRQIEQDDQGQQTQGQVEGEAPPPESAGHRLNQAGRALRPDVDIIWRGQPGSSGAA